MMLANESTVYDRLQLGVQAARTGQTKAAVEHLIAVIRQQPNNISAHLWLAYIASSPYHSVRLLKRVLTLHPDNTQAKAGLKWAEAKLAAPHAQAASNPTTKPLVAPTANGTAQSKAPSNKKVTLPATPAWSARTMFGAVVVAAFLTVVALGLGALVFNSVLNAAAGLTESTADAAITSIEEEVADESAVAHDNDNPEAQTAPALASVADGDLSAESEAEASQIPQAAGTRIPQALIPAQMRGTSVDIATISDRSVTMMDIDLPSIFPESPALTDLQELDQEAASQAVDPAFLAHQPAYPGEKWIEVNVTSQEVTAWEGDVPVMRFVVSTGLPNTPTVLGKFHIYWKLQSTRMFGPGYDLPNVPYTMYFYRGYALHGAYWHDNFGQPMSHGCVNFTPEEARQLFDWAGPVIPAGHSQVTATADNPGTLVVVRN